MVGAKIGGLRVTILSMEDAIRLADKIVPRILEVAGDVLHANVKTNISLRDHSLYDLERNHDHPYAKRHGSIQIHAGENTGTIRDSRAQIHSQSGDLLDSLKHGMVSRNKWVIKFDTGVALHAKWLVGGSKVMLPRDVLGETAMAKGTKKSMMKAITRVLGSEMRTKATVRFTSSPTAPGTSLNGE